jgi:hypothetical protein
MASTCMRGRLPLLVVCQHVRGGEGRQRGGQSHRIYTAPACSYSGSSCRAPSQHSGWQLSGGRGRGGGGREGGGGVLVVGDAFSTDAACSNIGSGSEGPQRSQQRCLGPQPQPRRQAGAHRCLQLRQRGGGCSLRRNPSRPRPLRPLQRQPSDGVEAAAEGVGGRREGGGDASRRGNVLRLGQREGASAAPAPRSPRTRLGHLACHRSSRSRRSAATPRSWAGQRTFRQPQGGAVK